MKYNLMYDYAEGAHPDILHALERTNFVQQLGYGDDFYCGEAAQIIKSLLENEDAEVHFVSGGTHANLIVLSSSLRPYESVIAASTGHISIHEAGAIESSGHKINEVFVPDGKLTREKIQEVIEVHTDEHCVIPKLVYISNATELGNIYNKNEIELLSEFCRSRGLLFYMDGARLGSSIMSAYQDLKMSDLCELLDAFYIGGTKNGALLGEAIVIVNNDLKRNFRHSIKQRGGLLAKGRVIGLQFSEMFRKGLFFELAAHANKMADLLAVGIAQKGYRFYTVPQTNMLFPVFREKEILKMEENYLFYRWKKLDADETVIRLVTSWATDEKMILKFINEL
ncbi:MAG: aminotransferase class V-fold PLP-dependent enzyme [Saprospiraceae bacterium]|nr:aminotransferase class V-fold PLP-dependent enzyme [Saprospiraceae bacterium]